ncbi:hypothetical protein Enr13x_60390 [Stieleria neptunia]|uniref:Secreted protein n=1 Tax=Stieleria neptunia TaxID=2527979 RepID=A0A518HZ60_9BACT|nr:hypothetical protein [Stieleria neptunia]QDV46135.1 hypothetical protein Enr13x_60390 [Stieleria neptunia]
MSKLFYGLILATSCLLAVGCGSEGTTSVVEGAQQSDVDEYNRILQEEQAQMKAGMEAAAKEGIKDY